jgi:serine protease Do
LSQPDEKVDLLHAALLVAKYDNLTLDVEPYRRQVEEMAREVRTAIADDAGDDTRLEALTKYLFAENGFHGSRTDYYNRANSYLNEVIDDHEGLPITLSVLFMELARRIGVDRVVGLPLPGHFMVGIEQKDGEMRIIDAFNGGKRVSRGEAQDRVIETTGDGYRESDLRPATRREIVVRMLHNLFSVAEQSGTPADAVRYLDLIVALTPDSVPDRVARFRARLQSGNTSGAKEDLQWLIERKPRGMDVEQLKELYRSL